LLAGVGTQIQIANPTETASQLLAAATEPADRRPPRTFAPLPRRVTLEQIQRPADVSPTWIALGLGGDDSGPIDIDLFKDPQPLFISGGPDPAPAAPPPPSTSPANSPPPESAASYSPPASPPP